MTIFAFRFRAQNVQSLSDLVTGIPGAISLSLHARAILLQAGFSATLAQLAYGVEDYRYDNIPVRIGRNYAYQKKRFSPTSNIGNRYSFLAKERKTGEDVLKSIGGDSHAINDEGRLDLVMRLVWDIPDLSPDALPQLQEKVFSLPFLGGQVLHFDSQVPSKAETLGESEVIDFFRGSYLSFDQTAAIQKTLRETNSTMRDMAKAIAWRGFWQREYAEPALEALKQEFRFEPRFQGLPLPKEHPLVSVADEHPGYRMAPVGYRQLGQAVVGRPGSRTTQEPLPHVFAEMVYGVLEWKYIAKNREYPKEFWWKPKIQRDNPVFYLVTN